MRSFFRGILRLSLAALIGLLIAWPVRKVFGRSSPVHVEAAATAPSKPQADGAVSDAPRRNDREPEPPYPTGVVIVGDKVLVSMSDRTIRYQHRSDLENEYSDDVSQVTRGSVVIGGKRLHFKPAPRPEVATSMQTPPVVAAPSVASSPPPSASLGSWRLDPDGVYRIVGAGSIGKP